MVESEGGKVERMGASLNIKNPEVYQLARQLADETGETLTTAVEIALRERLKRQKGNPKAGLTEWLAEITKETAAIMDDGRTSKELMDELYDPETGLPR
jgi:antitoxin VapB